MECSVVVVAVVLEGAEAQEVVLIQDDDRLDSPCVVALHFHALFPPTIIYHVTH